MARLVSRRALALALVALGVGCGSSPRRFAVPPAAAATATDHQPFSRLLGRYVGAKGGVDYDRWHDELDDVDALDRYLGALTASPPDSSPGQFASVGAKLSYWINLYNAIVIREVLRRWPLESVRDVSPTLTGKIIRGKGFFKDLTFVIGSKTLSLDDIEHEILRRRFDDARIHFALNCGSASCPVLQRGSFEPGDLDRQLESAAIAFVNDRRNVSVQHVDRTVRLSKLFDWYSSDFVAHAKSRRLGSDIQAFVRSYARGKLALDLDLARGRGYELRFEGYDWSVNSSKRLPETRGRRAPTLEISVLGGSRFRTAAHDKPIVIELWATWCRPCREMLPKLAAVAAARDDITVIAMSVDADDDRVRDFLAPLGLAPEMKIARDPRQATMAALGVRAVPTLVLIENGELRVLGGVDDIPAKQPTARAR